MGSIFVVSFLRNRTNMALKVVLSAALLAVALAAPQHPAPAAGYAPGPILPPVYAYNYAVKDDYSGSIFSQQESRDNYNAAGSYSVNLPDGRVQIVTYSVNGEGGYVADVKYEGEAIYADVPAYKPAPAYKAAPVYKPAPAPVYKPAPKPVVYKPAPAPAYKPAPAPAYKPAPVYHKAPVYHAAPAAPVYRKYSYRPVEAAPAPVEEARSVDLDIEAAIENTIEEEVIAVIEEVAVAIEEPIVIEEVIVEEPVEAIEVRTIEIAAPVEEVAAPAEESIVEAIQTVEEEIAEIEAAEEEEAGSTEKTPAAVEEAAPPAPAAPARFRFFRRFF